jgi:hypothetical protein
MKITKKYLKQIIKEEITRLSEEVGQEELPLKVKEKSSGVYLGKIQIADNIIRYYFRGRPETPRFSKRGPQVQITRVDYYPGSDKADRLGDPDGKYKFSAENSDEYIMKSIHNWDAPKETHGDVTAGMTGKQYNRFQDVLGKTSGM